MMDFHLLIGSAHPFGHFALVESSFFFLASFLYTVFALGTRRGVSPRLNLVVIGLGFLLQTQFLIVRGHLRGRCPLTNLFEVIGFLCWGLVFFLSARRQHLPAFALGYVHGPVGVHPANVRRVRGSGLAPRGGRMELGPVNPWLEFHAAFSVLSFGAFALAGLAGGMYLWQERQLKTHRLQSVFFQLPPSSISDGSTTGSSRSASCC